MLYQYNLVKIFVDLYFEKYGDMFKDSDKKELTVKSFLFERKKEVES